MPPRKRKTDAEPPAAPPLRPEKREARWRWLRHKDGSLVAERIDRRWERTQAEADLYGNVPLLSTGAHMRPINSILTELASSLRVQEADIAPEMLAQAWQEAAGSFLATQAELTALSNGVATIRTLHPAVRFELQRHKKEIILALNRALGEGCVRQVRLVHG